MDQIKLQLLYGNEFWDKLEQLIKNAKERIFFMSAFLSYETYQKYRKMVPSKVPFYVATRDDKSNYKPQEAILIDSKDFHGKLYVIDNTVIIGSQNLYNANKEGEYSTLIETNDEGASLILYQALLKLTEKSIVKPAPIDHKFYEFYRDGHCPFCNNEINTEEFFVLCPHYGGGEKYVTAGDCQGQNNEGDCFHCLPESRNSITAYGCDRTGCGLGIEFVTEVEGKSKVENMYLIENALTSPNNTQFELVMVYLKLFNFIQSKEIDAKKFLTDLLLSGDVYNTVLKRQEYTYIKAMD